MNEIKLKSYRTYSNSGSDSEEYHEIKQNTIQKESTFSAKPSIQHIDPYDFFTQHEVKTRDKVKRKKKKDKNKENPNIMDIIKTELALTAPLICENVIELINHDNGWERLCHRNIELKKVFRSHDVERGTSFKTPLTNLRPIFPKILENTLVKDFPINVLYVEPIMFEDLATECTAADNTDQTKKFLDFEIQNLKFIHHHMFSLETLLLAKLIEHYDEYLSIQTKIKEISRNIKISRETKNNLREQLLKITNNNKEKVRFDKTLLKYTEQLFHNKDIYFDLLKKHKDVIHKLISLWSDVEMVREKTGKTEINYYLNIKKTSDGDNNYKKKWNDIFEAEYSDMLDKIELEYAKAYTEYKEAKNRLNENNIDKKKINRPKLEINEDELKIKTEAVIEKILAKDKVEIILECNKETMRELLRPVQVIVAHDYYFKIFVDDVFVCESELYTCKDPLFNLEISETFSVQILPKNKILQIFLYENDLNVSCVKVNIEEIKKNMNVAEYTHFVFTYDLNIYPNSKHVGSGHGIKDIAVENKVRLKSGNMFKGKLFTACNVNIKLGWNEKFSENTREAILDSVRIERDIKRYLQGSDKPDVNNLINIINYIYDRNVEEDETIANALQSIIRTRVREDFTFPVEDADGASIRLKLLHLRNNGGFVNIENKLVPLIPSQISTEQLNCLYDSNESKINIQNFEDDIDMEPIDLQRYMGMKYVQKLNEKLQKTVNEFLLQKTHKDVVKDFKDLSLRGLLSNEVNLLKLSVSYFVTRQQLLNECFTKDQEIQITVLRAFNLPDRAADILADNDEEDADRIAGFKLRQLRPFVKLSYHGVTGQTAPGIGCCPSWNQTIKIRAKFTPFSPIHVNVYDECKVNLKTEGLTDASNSRSVQYQRCSRWLGSLLIPITTVLSLGTFRGTFKLISPPLLIGYENPTTKEIKTLIPDVKEMMKKDISFLTLHISTSLSHLGGVQPYSQPVPYVSDDRTINQINAFLTEYLNMFPLRSISLTYVDSFGRNKCVTDFLQPINLPDFECFPKNPKESGSATSKSSVLSKSSSSKSSDKVRDGADSPLAEMTPMHNDTQLSNWRNEDIKFMKMVNICLRYVSLIPTYEVIDAQIVTLTGLELLRVGYGSPIDHTILLASYFLRLGIKCWVINGVALPRGLSTYVLAKYDLVTRRYITVVDHAVKRGLFKRSEDFVWHVFDAVTGERFELRDVACPLKTALYVFDTDNIWVNIQSSLDCECVSFNFSKTSDWRQVFGNPRVVETQVLTDASLYSAPSQVDRLQDVLESKIRSKVQKWRPRTKTIWNRYCCTLLRETLPQWEYWSFNSTDPRPEPGHRLKKLMISYKMFGFPLNMHYVNTKTVLANVKATAVHANDDPDVEFALATQVFTYPNNVISVWIYLASVTRVKI
ncbi:protein CC2D2B [Battus philenor]|uniref:protein CC2D2B n=1 Tax=Battus philenor TaxID=42288 RepID=UPI0035CFC509